MSVLDAVAESFARLRGRFRRKVLGVSDRDVILAKLPKDSVGVEIGVWRGEFSLRLLREAQPARLHLVDPWSFSPEFAATGYGATEARRQEELDAICADVAAKAGADARVTIHREPSDAFWAKTEADSLDWAYIDGDHRYEAVLADFDGALRCVRPGGLIVGDDYNVRRDGAFPVKRAVKEFVRRHDLAGGFRAIGGQYLIRV